MNKVVATIRNASLTYVLAWTIIMFVVLFMTLDLYSKISLVAFD